MLLDAKVVTCPLNSNHAIFKDHIPFTFRMVRVGYHLNCLNLFTFLSQKKKKVSIGRKISTPSYAHLIFAEKEKYKGIKLNCFFILLYVGA